MGGVPWSRFSADPRTHGQVRASDADRAVVSDVLAEAYALGQIDPEEFDERSEAANRLKTLGGVPELIDDLVIAEADEIEPARMSEADRAQALARLNVDPIPITPEQIEAAAQKYYRDRVRTALLGMLAGPAGLTVAIWAVTSLLSGSLIFFWPIFVIVPMIGGTIAQIAGKDKLIRDRKRKLTQRARAHLGDAEAARSLEAERDAPGHDRPEQEDRLDENFQHGLQPPHPLEPPFPPHPRSHPHDGRPHRRDRGNPWDD